MGSSDQHQMGSSDSRTRDPLEKQLRFALPSALHEQSRPWPRGSAEWLAAEQSQEAQAKSWRGSRTSYPSSSNSAHATSRCTTTASETELRSVFDSFLAPLWGAQSGPTASAESDAQNHVRGKATDGKGSRSSRRKSRGQKAPSEDIVESL
jgi:hypothetical protein